MQTVEVMDEKLLIQVDDLRVDPAGQWFIDVDIQILLPPDQHTLAIQQVLAHHYVALAHHQNW